MMSCGDGGTGSGAMVSVVFVVMMVCALACSVLYRNRCDSIVIGWI